LLYSDAFTYRLMSNVANGTVYLWQNILYVISSSSSYIRLTKD